MCRVVGLINRKFSEGARAPSMILCPSCEAGPADGPDYVARHYSINGHLDSYRHPIDSGWDYETRVGRDSFHDYGGCYPPGNDWNYWSNWQPYKLSFVTNQATVCAFVDSNDEVDDYAQVWWENYGWRICATRSYGTRATRHGGGGNVGYLDGHTDWKSREYFNTDPNQCEWLVDPDTSNMRAWWDSNFGD